MSKRVGIMLATLFTEKLFHKMPKPVYVQPKIEGDRMRAVIREGKVTLLSSGGKERTSVPHIKQEIELMRLNNIELDGELYRHGMRHSDIRSIVSRTKNLHPDHKKMEYHMYDTIDINLAQHHRLNDLDNILTKINFSPLKIVSTVAIVTLEQLQEEYKRYLHKGYEGIIIRSPHAEYLRRKCTTLLKLKPRVSEYFEIIGVEEEKDLAGKLKGTFGAFVLKTKEGNIFNAGSGPTKYQRELFWKHQKYFTAYGIKAKIRFQDYTKVKQVPKLLSIDKEWLVRIQTILEN